MRLERTRPSCVPRPDGETGRRDAARIATERSIRFFGAQRILMKAIFRVLAGDGGVESTPRTLLGFRDEETTRV